MANKFCVMIEREERWCEVSAKRMQQEVFDFGLTEQQTKPTQQEIFE